MFSRSGSNGASGEVEAHILIIYTGGTIGMKTRLTDGVYIPHPNYLVPQLKKQPIFHDPDYELETDENSDNALVLPKQVDSKRIIYHVHEYEPLLDSSNMTFDEYGRIARDIEMAYYNYDAFVVLHGTDTMAFTASALAFMFENLGKPVILTGSQIPIFEARSDGRNNLLGALLMAGNYNIPEVTVYFDNVLLRGCRSTKINAEAFDAFKSPNQQPLAKLEVKIHVEWEAVSHNQALQKFHVHTNMCRDVGVLRLFPSITEATVRAFLQPPMQGVVLQTYGAGNGPAARLDLMQILKDACDRGVIIVNCTQCYHGSVSPMYAVGKDLEEIGVIAGSDNTVEAALMKLSYVLGHDHMSVGEKRKMMSLNLRGEMTVAKQSPRDLFHASLIEKLADAMKISSSEEVKVLRAAIFPYLLCAAAREGNKESLYMLKDAGAHFHMSDYDGRTALHIAASEGNADVTKFLLENGARAHLRDRYGHTPLDDAIRFNRYDVINLLRETGAHLTVPPSKQGMMMCNAVKNSDDRNLEAWLVAGCNINQGDYNGRTPLHMAVVSAREEQIGCLLTMGADPTKPDIDGCNPLDEARRLGNPTIIGILEKSSVNADP